MGIPSPFAFLPLIASEIYPTVVGGLAMSINSVNAMIGSQPIHLQLRIDRNFQLSSKRQTVLLLVYSGRYSSIPATAAIFLWLNKCKFLKKILGFCMFAHPVSALLSDGVVSNRKF
uniref:Uncharacterized protein n=1 Tax=Glossina brevipalpis TaxID=37001 RepID=A0A1A9WR94_9MUSC